jgi:UDP-N-acetylglucosamine 1-carboxyvinyltransferase
VLENAPDLADIATMGALLTQHGLVVEHDRGGRRLIISGKATSFEAPYDIVRRMRASVLVLGPLLARFGRRRSRCRRHAPSHAAGDLHLRGLERSGAVINPGCPGYIHATAPKGLRARRMIFPPGLGVRHR